MEWMRQLRAWLAAGTPCVSVVVAGVRGSIPREPGTRMLVSADAMHGTVGGGNLEFKALELARGMLAGEGARIAQYRFPLGPSLGQCCGGATWLVMERFLPQDAAAGLAMLDDLDAALAGHPPALLATWLDGGERPRVFSRRDAGCADGVAGPLPAQHRAAALALLEDAQAGALMADGVLLERVAPPAFEVMLFGAGHVGRALARVLGELPVSLTWVDSREAEFPADAAGNVRKRLADDPQDEVARAAPGTAFLVMTHSHALDQDLCERILRRGDFAYLGLIGSGTKRARFEQRFAARGLDAALVARMTCPIGIPGVTGKEPGVIAVAVAAQLMQLRAARPAATPRAVPGAALA
jgi:xanthine dehydrogenase accessory factor